MDIYLIRHADALPLGANGIATDEERPLTEDGWKQASNLGKAFQRLGITLDGIVTSPLVRAQQTAVQLRTILGLADTQLVTTDELAPGGRSKKLARVLNGLQGNSFAVIGHQPDLSMYAAWFLGEKEVQVHFAKGAAAYIHFDDAIIKGAGTLMWLVPPAWLG